MSTARAVTRVAVIAHVKATCSRSGGFAKDWADTSGDSLAWLGRHVLCVSDFTWAPKYMELQKLVVASSSAPARACAAPSEAPLFEFTRHTAAVKALAWCPWQKHLLASGGGTADRCIRFWNTLTGAGLNCVDTGSQVCNLMWSKNVNEVRPGPRCSRAVRRVTNHRRADCEHARLLAQPDHRLAIPLHVEGASRVVCTRGCLCSRAC